MAASSSMTRMRARLSTRPESLADADEFKGDSTSGMNGFPQQGKFKMEGCAGADGAFDVNLAGVLLDDAVGDGKSQAGAAAVAGTGHILGGKKRIIDSFEVLGRDAASGVVHQRGHEVVATVGQRGYAQAAAAGHGLLGVQQQVEKYLLQLAGVAVDGRQLLGQLEIDKNRSEERRVGKEC